MTLLTEDEARTKWCPMARVVTQLADNLGVAAINRHEGEAFDNTGNLPGYPLGACRCIASQCMAWRAAPVEYGEIVRREACVPGSRRPEWADGKHGDDWIAREAKPRRGYCGAFGRPG